MTPCPHCHNPRDHSYRCRTCTNHRRRATRARLDRHAIDATIATHHAPTGLRPRERRAIAARFTALGLPAQEIARILGVTTRTVYRWRARDRDTEPAT
ncbi:helix-turn-helix domain-containing protein [Streptomyces lasiicapitis]|uniref:helix-turn-helix domain-containing protein n=1 Tax=Streptomyces lasiicapitis TaxID=1923961 RepID=UPI003667C285